MIGNVRIAPSDRVFNLASVILASAVGRVQVERALTIAERLIALLEDVERLQNNGLIVKALILRADSKFHG